jgi:hypothetical protein
MKLSLIVQSILSVILLICIFKMCVALYPTNPGLVQFYVSTAVGSFLITLAPLINSKKKKRDD